MAVINMLPQGTSYKSLADLVTAEDNSFDGFSLHSDVLELSKTTSGTKSLTLTNITDEQISVRVIYNQSGWNNFWINVLGQTGSSANTTVTIQPNTTYTISANGTAQGGGSYVNIFVFRTFIF